MTSDMMNIDTDLSDDDLSSATGTETLLARDLVSGALPTSTEVPAEHQVHHIGGIRYLAVDQSANRRHSSKVSKVWQDGLELRTLDISNLDKYWLCNHCLPTTKINKITTSDGNTNTTTPIRHLKRKRKVDYQEKEDDTNGTSSPTSVTVPSLFRTARVKAA